MMSDTFKRCSESRRYFEGLHAQADMNVSGCWIVKEIELWSSIICSLFK